MGPRSPPWRRRWRRWRRRGLAIRARSRWCGKRPGAGLGPALVRQRGGRRSRPRWRPRRCSRCSMRSRPPSGGTAPSPNAPGCSISICWPMAGWCAAGPQPPLLPHPRMAERAFVLLSPGATSGRTGATLRPVEPGGADRPARPGSDRSTISALRAKPLNQLDLLQPRSYIDRSVTICTGGLRPALREISWRA